MDRPFANKSTRGGTIWKHSPSGGQAKGGSKPKLTPCLSYYQYRYSHMNNLLANGLSINSDLGHDEAQSA